MVDPAAGLTISRLSPSSPADPRRQASVEGFALRSGRGMRFVQRRKGEEVWLGWAEVAARSVVVAGEEGEQRRALQVASLLATRPGCHRRRRRFV